MRLKVSRPGTGNAQTDSKETEDDNMSESGKNAAHREGSQHGRFTWNIKYLSRIEVRNTILFLCKPRVRLRF